MTELRLAWVPVVSALFFSGIPLLASAPALASSSLPVSGLIVVQPITVCAADCTGCAPVNDKAQTSSPSYIGFLDPTTGANMTEEILAHDLGLRITWLPLQRYCSSSTNSNPSWSTTTYQTLHILQDSQGNLSSPDFMTLAQQPSIANNHVVPNPTTPPGGTACAVNPTNGNLQSPCVPVSTTPTTISMFFVNKFLAVAPATGVPYGYGMINGNGVAINAGTVTNGVNQGGIFKPSLGTPPQIDVLAHELAHDLSLPHLTSAVSGLTTCPTDFPNPGCDLMAAGGTRLVWGTPTTTRPLTTFDQNLVAGNVDALAAAQQNQVLDPTGLLAPIQHVTTTIVADPARGANFFDYTTTVIGDPNSTALLTRFIFIFQNPKGFQPSSFTIIPPPPSGVTVTGSNFNGSPGNGILCGTADVTSSVKCWDVELSPGLSSGQTLKFALALSSSIKNPQLSNLQNGEFAYFFSDQVVTTNNLIPTPPLPQQPTTLTADSTLSPDLTIPLFLSVPSSFVGSGVPCTPDILTGACSTIGIFD